jgi:1-acyl-sn-glycerol-3-phosphate acyltransferase
MVERQPSGVDGGAHAVPAAGAGQPRAAEPVALREHLPGLEPERQVSDWGRSELVEGFLDRAVYDFLYHYWFRVEVEGIEHVPADGPALLLANRSGGLPADVLMIVKAVRQEHRHPRPVHVATDRSLARVPGLDMLIVKAGGVSGHPANLHRLLFDERQLVLGFPEGGEPRPLRERYRVRTFARRELVQAAIVARAAIVPVAVLGGEEAAPVLGAFPRGPLGRLARLPRRALAPLPLPAKVRLRFLEPVPPARLERAADDGAGDLAEDLRALLQENLLEMLAERRSVWLG